MREGGVPSYAQYLSSQAAPSGLSPEELQRDYVEYMGELAQAERPARGLTQSLQSRMRHGQISPEELNIYRRDPQRGLKLTGHAGDVGSTYNFPTKEAARLMVKHADEPEKLESYMNAHRIKSNDRAREILLTTAAILASIPVSGGIGAAMMSGKAGPLMSKIPGASKAVSGIAKYAAKHPALQHGMQRVGRGLLWTPGNIAPSRWRALERLAQRKEPWGFMKNLGYGLAAEAGVEMPLIDEPLFRLTPEVMEDKGALELIRAMSDKDMYDYNFPSKQTFEIER